MWSPQWLSLHLDVQLFSSYFALCLKSQASEEGEDENLNWLTERVQSQIITFVVLLPLRGPFFECCWPLRTKKEKNNCDLQQNMK